MARFVGLCHFNGGMWRYEQNWMDKQSASHWIAEETLKEIPETDRNQFIGVVEIELESLHSGNIARYRLRPSEFESWKAAWKS